MPSTCSTTGLHSTNFLVIQNSLLSCYYLHTDITEEDLEREVAADTSLLRKGWGKLNKLQPQFPYLCKNGLCKRAPFAIRDESDKVVCHGTQCIGSRSQQEASHPAPQRDALHRSPQGSSSPLHPTGHWPRAPMCPMRRTAKGLPCPGDCDVSVLNIWHAGPLGEQVGAPEECSLGRLMSSQPAEGQLCLCGQRPPSVCTANPTRNQELPRL